MLYSLACVSPIYNYPSYIPSNDHRDLDAVAVALPYADSNFDRSSDRPWAPSMRGHAYNTNC